LAAVFAAVYFVLRSIQTFRMIGPLSGRFTAGDFILTSIALVAGPSSGILSVLIGTIVAYPINPPTFYGLDFLPAMTNVSIAGLILSSRLWVARAVYLAVLIAFLISPYSLLFGYSYIPYTWLHLVALAILLSPIVGKVPTWVTRSDSRLIAAIAALAFVGTMAQHLTGGLLFEATAGFLGGINPFVFKRDLWPGIFLVYPPERLFIVAVSTFVATALFRSMRKLAF
jgi:hypothetical protein